MSTRVVVGVGGSCFSAAVGEPDVSTRVVEPFISLPLGLFSYTERFSLQMAAFVTSREQSCERCVKRSGAREVFLISRSGSRCGLHAVLQDESPASHMLSRGARTHLLLPGDRARPRAGRGGAVPDLEPRPRRGAAEP